MGDQLESAAEGRGSVAPTRHRVKPRERAIREPHTATHHKGSGLGRTVGALFTDGSVSLDQMLAVPDGRS
jgi:hypothetical protein